MRVHCGCEKFWPFKGKWWWWQSRPMKSQPVRRIKNREFTGKIANSDVIRHSKVQKIYENTVGYKQTP
jgi:hypothetical protein